MRYMFITALNKDKITTRKIMNSYLSKTLKQQNQIDKIYEKIVG